MLELIVLAEEIFAKAALEDSSAKVPDSSFTLGADDVR